MNEIEEKYEALSRYIEAYDINNLPTLIFQKEDAEYLRMACQQQAPKKAIEIRDRHNFKGEVIYKDGYCPICKNEMSSAYHYCNKCGRKIDWK